jgi:fucose permease
MADEWGKRRVLSVTMVGFSVSLLLMSIVPSFALACLVMVFIGGFGGIIESQIGALVAALNPHRTSYYLNLAQVFFAIGAVVGPIAAGLLLSVGADWRVCYILTGILALALTGVFLLIRAPVLSATDRMSWPAFRSLVSDRRFLLICLCMLMYTGAEVGSWGWMSTFLTQGMGFSVVKSSTAVGVFWIAVTAGRFLCGLLTLRFDLRVIIVTLAALSALVTALSGFAASEPMVWCIIVAMGLTYSSQWPLIVAYGNAHYTTSSGTVFALLVGSGGLGTTVIPYAMGVIGEQTTVRIAMISPAILLLAIAAIFFRMERASAVAAGELAKSSPA